MVKPKMILGIETSCDETAAAVCLKDKDGVHHLSDVVASSASLQAKYGGIIPEQAAREQLKSIIPVIQEALVQSNLYPPSSKNHLPSSIIHRPNIDAIAVTQGPGLIGSLLVGVETAKTLALVWDKPLVPVNHLIGHFYANWITLSRLRGGTREGGTKGSPNSFLGGVGMPTFPYLGLLVSGGHTDLVIFKDHGAIKYLGGTRDDAAGECFDKCARLLGLPYPGGPSIAKAAEGGNPKVYKLPRPMINSDDFDFSFSGLKTAVLNTINANAGGAKVSSRASTAVRQLADEDVRLAEAPAKRALEIPKRQDPRFVADLAAAIEDAITDVLVKKTVRAAQSFNIEHILVAGGVAANKTLAKKLRQIGSEKNSRAQIFIPPPTLCTDNAAYIATAAFFNFKPIDPLKLRADPNLTLAS